jgi:hypothetical protein
MKVETLAGELVKACVAENVDYMIAGAFAYGMYGIPRSTKDVDIVLSVKGENVIFRVIERLSEQVEFGDQVQFDTLTWGKRHVGKVIGNPQLQVELFELFDDPFVLAQFERKVLLYSPQVGAEIWAPTAEDVLVQKLRWGRAKDLDDARDIIAIQEIKNLEMDYVHHWCGIHKSEERLREAINRIPKDL